LAGRLPIFGGHQQRRTNKGLKEWKKISAKFPEKRKKIYILGAGTNLLISEKGFDGLVIHNLIGGIEKRGTDVVVGSGVMLNDLLIFVLQIPCPAWNGREDFPEPSAGQYGGMPGPLPEKLKTVSKKW